MSASTKQSTKAETVMSSLRVLNFDLDYKNMTHSVYLLMLIVLSLTHGLLFLSFGALPLVYLDISVIIIYSLTLIFLEPNSPTLSRIISHVVPMLHCFFYCCLLLSRDSGMFLYQLTLVPAIFLFFEARHAKLQVLLTFAILVFSILSLTYRIADPIFDLNKVQNDILATIAVLTSSLSLYVFYLNYSRQLEDKNRELIHLAQTDPLTAISNRRHFIEEARLAEKSTLSHVILLIDLDYFKSINDNYGHLNGDLALTQSAALFIELAQTKDLVARLGGEEFAILLRGYSSAQAFQLAQSIRLRFSEFEFKTDDERSFYMTLSIGVANLEDDYQTSLKTADQALYVAKSGGRNMVILGE